MPRVLNVAVEGCCHGALDNIYSQLLARQQRANKTVDLLIICGDFQAIRNVTDLGCMSCPDKYKQIGGFYRYYTGEKAAPVPTIFVGGNHEAGNHMRELHYGGWVAPNIYFLGSSGVVRFGGLRIGGISGIYKDHDYPKGFFEYPPFGGHARSAMHHVRSFEAFKMLQIRQPLDIVVSHDWPARIERCGDTEGLLRAKPFFRAEVERGDLGSPVNSMLLERLRPAWWFSAHLHVRFTAEVLAHDIIDRDGFLSLDKCLPRRDFLEIIEVEVPDNATSGLPQLEYDPEWLAILRLCHPYMPLDEMPFNPPTLAAMTGGEGQLPLFPDALLKREVDWVQENVFKHGPKPIPPNFVPVAPAPPTGTPDHVSFGLARSTDRRDRGRGRGRGGSRGRGQQRRDDAPWPGPRPDTIYPNPQTDDFCRMLAIHDQLTQRRRR
ncbi:lariat debranching enzyme [Coemansia sp. RSA 552]|nr:lariat debranching enzyme [Coemansia sp. RSA 552]